MSTLHVRYNGQSHDIPFTDIFTEERLEGIGADPTIELNTNHLNPEQVKQAVAQHFDVAVSEFDNFQVEYHKTGNITVRPDAVFG
jgi:predicted unusual protein kinase regulating ubiquinone biosynthesis (AarF/ABC1/UbiB family)